MKPVLILVALLYLTNATLGQDKVLQLDSIFSASAKAGKFNGNVLIAEKGKIIYQKSFGKADRSKNLDLNAESVFELASVSKQFTAMGIMLLKKQGKLRYEDSLRKFFPALPYHNITILQLLHHTSGMPDYMELFTKHWDSTKIATNKDVIELLAKYKPAMLFAPGSKWDYSNTGYALLASIIEKVSGQSFGDYLAKYIFKPLQMTRSSIFRRRYEKRAMDNYAYGYEFDKKAGRIILPDSSSEVGAIVYSLDGIVGDGTVNSTTNDLFKWDRALYTEKLVSKEMMQEALSPGKLNDGTETEYGFGWGVGEMVPVGKLANHSGGWPGYATFIERHIDSDKTIIVLSNQGVPAPYIRSVRNILYGIREEATKQITVGPAKLKEYIGDYELMPGFVLSITVEEGRIFAQATGQEQAEIFPEKEDLFFVKVVEAKIKFVRDEKAAVKSLILYQSGQEIEGAKIK